MCNAGLATCVGPHPSPSPANFQVRDHSGVGLGIVECRNPACDELTEPTLYREPINCTRKQSTAHSKRGSSRRSAGILSEIMTTVLRRLRPAATRPLPASENVGLAHNSVGDGAPRNAAVVNASLSACTDTPSPAHKYAPVPEGTINSSAYSVDDRPSFKKRNELCHGKEHFASCPDG